MKHDHQICDTYLAAIDVLSKPWNGQLMFVLGDGPLRFSELAERVPDIGDRMLSARLRELEERGLITRTVDPGPPVRVSYELTSVGRGFGDVADAIMRWGKALVRAQEAAAPPPTQARARTNRG